MKLLLVAIFVIAMSLTTRALEIMSFSGAGVIECHSLYTNGTVTVERNCSLNGSSGWTEIGRIPISNATYTISIPMCDVEAYYRLTYYNESLKPTRINSTSSSNLPERRSIEQLKGVETTPHNGSTSTDPEVTIELIEAEPIEDIVVIKSPSNDDFVLLEQARQKIIVHWRMIYPSPLIFTNHPGSQADLQDMANALEKLSGKFYRVQ